MTTLASARLIKVLQLRKKCRYVLFVPITTGLTVSDLEFINDDLRNDGYSTTIVLVKSTDGIVAVEDQNDPMKSIGKEEDNGGSTKSS